MTTVSGIAGLVIPRPAHVADVAFEDRKSAQGSGNVRTSFAQGRVPVMASGPVLLNVLQNMSCHLVQYLGPGLGVKVKEEEEEEDEDEEEEEEEEDMFALAQFFEACSHSGARKVRARTRANHNTHGRGHFESLQPKKT